MNKDVFETLYLKRSSKSSHSSKSSNDSNRFVDDMASPHTKPNAFLTSNSKIYSNFNRSPSSIRSDKSRPQQYIFGSTYDRKAKDEPEKENIFKNNHYTTNQNSGPNSMNDETNSNIDDSDRFKTITINHLRRSFRDSFLDSAKPAKGREHQQLWFIDVNDKKEKSIDQELHKAPCRQPKNCDDDDDDNNGDDDDDDVIKYGRSGAHRVKRNETFRIDSKIVANNEKSAAISRRETFRINKNQSPNRSPEHSISAESDQTPGNIPNANKKPIAVTAPYSASNDADYQHSSPSLLSREYQTGNSNNIDRNRYRLNYKSSSSHSNEGRHSSLLDRYDRSGQFKPGTGSTAKTVIKIKPPYEDDGIYDGFTSQKRDLFENRSKLERQSFNDFNSSFDRGRENRSFASLRTKLEKTGQNNRFKFNTNTVDASNSGANNHEPALYRSRPPDATRIISNRPSSENSNTTNRSSFVPYRSNFDRYDDRKFDTPNTSSINSNRTTISIDYKPKRNNETVKNSQPHQHTFSIPLTASKSPVAVKPRSNKGRSVNFPSVECEVRLISPNCDTKPRRKESWKSKPANDWTFNKVHF